jgi:hypothetical protein
MGRINLCNALCKHWCNLSRYGRRDLDRLTLTFRFHRRQHLRFGASNCSMLITLDNAIDLAEICPVKLTFS